MARSLDKGMSLPAHPPVCLSACLSLSVYLMLLWLLSFASLSEHISCHFHCVVTYGASVTFTINLSCWSHLLFSVTQSLPLSIHSNKSDCFHFAFITLCTCDIGSANVLIFLVRFSQVRDLCSLSTQKPSVQCQRDSRNSSRFSSFSCLFVLPSTVR